MTTATAPKRAMENARQCRNGLFIMMHGLFLVMHGQVIPVLDPHVHFLWRGLLPYLSQHARSLSCDARSTGYIGKYLESARVKNSYVALPDVCTTTKFT
eukprot:scaffold5899_cov67-Skeletonema_dohrnii-CCMP3373.AAC.2